MTDKRSNSSHSDSSTPVGNYGLDAINHRNGELNVVTTCKSYGALQYRFAVTCVHNQSITNVASSRR